MQAKLTIDLAAIVANWRALARTEETAAVVKADAYGLGLAPVAKALAKAGARSFFVAQTEEGVALRNVLGPGAEIFVFGGLMAGDEAAFRDFELVPCLNSIDHEGALQTSISFKAENAGCTPETGPALDVLGREGCKRTAADQFCRQ